MFVILSELFINGLYNHVYKLLVVDYFKCNSPFISFVVDGYK